ncbi:MAG: TetR/AcrR family transcriptional regulator [Pseudomonadota bacterium]
MKDTPPSGEARTGEGRARILQTALEEFATRGFDGASTTSIARRSGFTQPLIHYHFGSKEGLWQATVNDLFSRLGGEFLAAIREVPPSRTNARATLLALTREFVRFCGKHPQFPRLLYLELPLASPRSQWLMDTWVRPVVGNIVTMHRVYAPESGMKDVPVGLLMAILTGAAATPYALGSFMQEAYGIDPSEDAMIERHAEALVSLVENGLFVDRRLAPR